jgi:hypothetical protein
MLSNTLNALVRRRRHQQSIDHPLMSSFSNRSSSRDSVQSNQRGKCNYIVNIYKSQALSLCSISVPSPPLAFYSRKPTVVLLDPGRMPDLEGDSTFEDPLDRHVDMILKTPAKFRRTMQGVWSFLKTRKYHCSTVLFSC